MPVLNPLTPYRSAMGYGTVSVDGSTPVALTAVTGNGAHWLSATLLVLQDYTATPVLKTYDVVSTVLTQVQASGANVIAGGGAIWAGMLGGTGITSNASGWTTLPLAALGEVNTSGQILVCDNYATSSGLTVYSSSSAVVLQIPTQLTSLYLTGNIPNFRLRGDLLSFQTALGWQLWSVAAGRALSTWLPRPSIQRLIPYTQGSDPAVLEYSGETNTLSVRLASRLIGLTIPSDLASPQYNPDVIGVDATTVRVAWSTGSGEAASELVVLVINTATGTTSLGTVSGGSVVFAAGPVLEGETFSGANAGGNRLPIQSQPISDRQGLITKPWRDALQTTQNIIQNIQTRQANTPIPISQPGFGVIATVEASQPNDTLAFASADSSITITPNQATKTIDFSVGGNISGADVALHRLCGGL